MNNKQTKKYVLQHKFDISNLFSLAFYRVRRVTVGGFQPNGLVAEQFA